MSYTNFTTDAVFTEPRLNAFCDLLIESVLQAFPPEVMDPENDYVLTSTILSGKAAAILQGDSGEIHNVTFICGREAIYNWILENVGSIVFKCKQISFKNRILLYPHPDLYFEIWYTTDDPEIAESGSINIHTLSDIPPQTL